MTEPTNLTLPDIQKYIEALAKVYAQGKPYSIDLTLGEVKTQDTVYSIRIPERILDRITLEEL